MKGTKRIFGLLAIVVGLLLTGFLVINVLAGPADVAEAAKMKVMTIELDAVITINQPQLEDPSASFFLTIGTIKKVNGKDATGIYYCRGVFTGGPVGLALPSFADGTPFPVFGLTFVDQYFLIDGQGTIVATGDEGVDAPSMVVTGGTGRFRGVEGTKTQIGIPFSPDFDFLSRDEGGGPMTHTFKINRAPKRGR